MSNFNAWCNNHRIYITNGPYKMGHFHLSKIGNFPNENCFIKNIQFARFKKSGKNKTFYVLKVKTYVCTFYLLHVNVIFPGDRVLSYNPFIKVNKFSVIKMDKDEKGFYYMVNNQRYTNIKFVNKVYINTLIVKDAIQTGLLYYIKAKKVVFESEWSITAQNIVKNLVLSR